MKMLVAPNRERGVSLIVGVVMLLLVTLVLTAAYMLSTSHLKAVGNMQFRSEAVASANAAIEGLISEDFISQIEDGTWVDRNTPVDIDNDGNDDYSVVIGQPQCVKATKVILDVTSSIRLPAQMTSTEMWDTIWEIRAVASDMGFGGASVTIVHGVSTMLLETRLPQLACPT